MFSAIFALLSETQSILGIFKLPEIIKLQSITNNKVIVKFNVNFKL